MTTKAGFDGPPFLRIAYEVIAHPPEVFGGDHFIGIIATDCCPFN